MIYTRHILTILLGTLLLTAACQKIDDSVFNNNKDTSENTDSSNGSSSSQSNGTETNDNSLSPTIMSDGTQWLQVNGHVIALADTVGNNVNALFISLYEWNNIHTGKSKDSTAISDSARNYMEGNLRGWRIPTKEEAKALYNVYKSTSPYISDTLNALNTRIKSLGGIPLNAFKNNYTDGYRYICQDSVHSFSLKYSESGFRHSVTGAGTGTTKYNLRLVKDSTINK